jgi:hypothetical protein
MCDGTPWSAPGAEPPSCDSSPVAEFWPDTADEEYYVKLPVALIGRWISDPASNNGVLMKTNPFSGDGVNLWSSEFDDPNRRPILEIELAAPW